MEEKIIQILNRLECSKFRSKFKLKEQDFEYIKQKGMVTIRQHAYDFISKRLAIVTYKDGKQTPMRGHPVFIAQHATATCCRQCLYKWHHIEATHTLTTQEINYVVQIIMLWIQQQIDLSA